MHANLNRFALIPLAALALAWVARPAAADVVTGTVTPQDARAVIVNSSGATVAQLKGGPYQLQLPVGRYKAKCEAPGRREQEFLSLSEPVTVNIDCK
jgi:fructose-1,6-bisphosphatase/inositol monophosphatase family enzyme